MAMLLRKMWGIVLAGAFSAPFVMASDAVPSDENLFRLMESSRKSATADQPLELRGEEVFPISCSQCHDTERATSQHKSYEGWLATVRRMAAKPGANIPESQIVPIANYLASLGPVDSEQEESKSIPPQEAVSAVLPSSINATVSLIWRDGGSELENQGFFPDVWVGAEWRPEGSPFSAQVTACTSCHDDPNGLKVELVEGSLSADLIQLLSGRRADQRDSDIKVDAKAGRFIVPFGAFSGMSHPGVYRTLTNPLMYNMGRRVQTGYPDPVIPMPYADEGGDLHVDMPLPAGIVVQLDGYAVNGLQEGFFLSRGYSDNNSNTAIGGRATAGNAWLQIGGSYSSGERQSSGNPKNTYRLAGGDITLRYQDVFRVYYEYARREEEFVSSADGHVDGHVAELEGRIWKKPRISLLLRYDTLDHSGSLGSDYVDRFTWGPNLTLPGGSLLIINHEHWMVDDIPTLKSEDIIGFRWVATF